MPIEVIPQPTPNPNAFKFTVRGKTFDSPVTFGSADAAAGTPFAKALFEIPGVASCFATADFVTITKGAGYPAIGGGSLSRQWLGIWAASATTSRAKTSGTRS